MPSRLLTIAIVCFWLAATSWFVVRDWLPHWRSDEAPPYSIELADEAARQIAPARWKIIRGGTEIGILKTSLRFRDADDTYELTAGCSELSLMEMSLPVVGALNVGIRNYDDRLSITSDGELRSMTTDVEIVIRIGKNPEIVGRAEFGAAMHAGKMERRFRLSGERFGEFAPALELGDPIRGSVLNPLHPIHRLSGLRPGQRWRQRLIAPHEEIIQAALAKLPGASSIAASLDSGGPRWLHAEVRGQTETMEWSRGEVECLVIDYRGESPGDDIAARTWIRRSDGLVLRQEAESNGQFLVLLRDD
jgi:hypothetical protein